MASLNLVEKIATAHAVGLPDGVSVRAGDYITIRPLHVLTHDNTGAVIPKFESLDIPKVKNPDQPVFALDHNIQDQSEKTLKKYAKIENFAKSQGIDFYPAGRGIGHQIMIEEGYAWPGSLVVASDSHANMYGGIGCLGTPVVRTDAAGLWATGQSWWQVPPVARIKLTGALREGVTGKDVLLALCGFFNQDELLNYALEFSGEGVRTLSIDQRLSMANMTTEWGALAGLFPTDEVTINWLKNRLERLGEGHARINTESIKKLLLNPFVPDQDAHYAKTVNLDLSTVSPMVTGPHNLKTAEPASEFRTQKKKIHKAYLVSCVNARFEDLKQAAEVLKDNKIHPDVTLYVGPASRVVQEDAKTAGYWQTILDAGARVLPPGCGPCIGLGEGLLDEGESGISATNRNFKGRMGSRDSEAYLASPLIVAQSSVSGFIDCPPSLAELSSDFKPKLSSSTKGEEAGNEKVKLVQGFPEIVSGKLLFCPADNLNTDGIYPGKYTYIDDFSPEQQASVVMENYDPEFAAIAREGDILVGGSNFGTGSSREQAATAFKYKGIQLVIAASFSETYKRNAFNNGFLLLEIPDLVKKLRSTNQTDALTIRTHLQCSIDFENSKASVGDSEFNFLPLGETAQALIVAGGLERRIKQENRNG